MKCRHGVDALDCDLPHPVFPELSPPPPVPEVDVEAVVRQLHDEWCACELPVWTNGNGCKATGIIRAAVQAGLDARGAEVERAAFERDEAIRIGAIDADERIRLEVEVERLGVALRFATDTIQKDSAEVSQLRARVKLQASLDADHHELHEVQEKTIASLESQLAELQDIDKVCDDLNRQIAAMGKTEDSLEVQLACLPEIEAALEAAERYAWCAYQDHADPACFCNSRALFDLIRAALAKVRP